MPTDASMVESARRPVALHRKSDLNRRRSGLSEPIMSLIRAAQWAGECARRRIESAGSEPVTSRGTLSTTALLRATMVRPDSVVAGQLPAIGGPEGNSWRRALGEPGLHWSDASGSASGAAGRRSEVEKKKTCTATPAASQGAENVGNPNLFKMRA
jgi:hypothetical protein